MLSFHLVRAIESHAEDLTRDVLKDLQTNPHTPTYHTHDRETLHRRIFDGYRHLGRWIAEKTESQIEEAYEEVGRQRCDEGVPLSEVVYALVLTKGHLSEYIRAVDVVGSAVELYQEEELYRLIGHFFDKATYYAARGYEKQAARRTSAA
jgi:hypothetical protein